MNRKEKEIAVNQLHQSFNDSKGAFLVNYKGLTVADMQNLRKQLRECGAKVKIAKDRLVKIAVRETPAQELDSFLNDQLAIVFAENDSSAAAKIVYDFAKESPLDIVAGMVEKNFFDKEKIERLAVLPSREVLLSQLCGVLKATVAKVARAVSLVAEQKGSASPAPEVVAKAESENKEEADTQESKVSSEEIDKSNE